MSDAKLELTERGRGKISVPQAEEIQTVVHHCLDQFVETGGDPNNILKVDVYPDHPDGIRVVVVLKG